MSKAAPALSRRQGLGGLLACALLGVGPAHGQALAPTLDLSLLYRPFTGGATPSEARVTVTTFSNASRPALAHDPDAGPAEIDQLPGPVAILGSSQEEVLSIVRLYPKLVAKGVIFACFDDWIGAAYPGNCAFVAVQDCEAIAAAAIGRIVGLLEGDDLEKAPQEIDIALKEIRRISDDGA